MHSIQNQSLKEEVETLNSLMNTSENSDEFIKSLKILRYANEKDIIKLFIRTSVTLKGLEAKLIKAGFDINCSCILEKNRKVSVIIPSLDKKSSVRALGKLLY